MRSTEDRPRRSFNPCCSGSGSSTSGWAVWVLRFELVSILVAVDRAHQQGMRVDARLRAVFQSLLQWIGLINKGYGSTRDCAPCFNPCCSGSGSSTRVEADLKRALITVSILVAVDRAHQPESPKRRQKSRATFQSLLQWIGLINSPRRSAILSSKALFQSLLQWIGLINGMGVGGYLRRRGVSILVAVDRAHQQDVLARGRLVEGAPFQSLLQWIGLINPGDEERPPRLVNVSILVAVDRAHQLRFRSAPYSSKGVSILVAVDRAHQPQEPPNAHPSCMQFQSLLQWIGLINPGRGNGLCPHPNVSILVAVDRAHQHLFRGGLGIDHRGFNTCCSGSGSSTR